MITPTGWEGNFFNRWTRASTQQELQESYFFPRKQWKGHHDVKVGSDFVHSAYNGTSVSHPVQLLHADNSLAGEIDFTPSGILATSDTEIAGFAGDHWILNDYISVDYGLRFSSQTLGAHSAFSPRGGFVLSPFKQGQTIVRGGVGVFYDRLPLLAGDFTQNPSRELTLFGTNGLPLGPPLVYQNTYEGFKENGQQIVVSGQNLGSTPYNVTWNMELDQEIRPHLIARASFLASRTYSEFSVNPEALSPTDGVLLLTNLGSSRYHEFESTLRYRPNGKADFNISYVNSQARGDLNTMAAVFVPYEEPVIHPNLFGTLPTSIPDRVVTWGRFAFPRKVTVSPVLDWHSGFPFSTVDDLQNYVGPPDTGACRPSSPSTCKRPKTLAFSLSRGCASTVSAVPSAFSMSPTMAISGTFTTPLPLPTSATTPGSCIASTTSHSIFCTDLNYISAEFIHADTVMSGHGALTHPATLALSGARPANLA